MHFTLRRAYLRPIRRTASTLPRAHRLLLAIFRLLRRSDQPLPRAASVLTHGLHSLIAFAPLSPGQIAIWPTATTGNA